MKYIAAIDPGNVESAYVLMEADTLRPVSFIKCENELMAQHLRNAADRLGRAEIIYTIEMVASYGMAVGAEVFETCVQIGILMHTFGIPKKNWIYRKQEKLTLCHSMRATDSNITQALIDRFAPGEANHGKGTKKHPGWFYGFRKDIWQAYAVGVTFHDLMTERG